MKLIHILGLGAMATASSTAMAAVITIYPQLIATTILDQYTSLGEPGTEGGKWNPCSAAAYWGCATYSGRNDKGESVFESPSPDGQAVVDHGIDFFIGGRVPNKTYKLAFYLPYAFTTTKRGSATDFGSIGYALRCIDPNAPLGTKGGLIQQPNSQYGNGRKIDGTGISSQAIETGVWIIAGNTCPENTFRLDVTMRGSQITFGSISYDLVIE